MRREVLAAQEGAAAARRDAEAEKERFKKVIQELKKKLDRCSPLTGFLLDGSRDIACSRLHNFAVFTCYKAL